MIRSALIISAILLLSASADTTADAQAYQCRLPDNVPPSALANPAPDGPVRNTRPQSYSLAISWSPEYCRNRRDNPRNARQCGGQEGAFGFVLHGLWPEGRGQGQDWPQWCPTRQTVSPAVARAQLCRTPSLSLITHEWAKHGSCMARRPEQYFEAAGRLMDSIDYPAMEALSRGDDLTVGDFKAAFIELNPAFRPDRISVQTNRGNWLTEIRLCYDRRFRPMRCPLSRRGAPDTAELKIWRGL